MNRLSRTTVSDILVLSLLSLLGIAGYETSFGDLNFLVAASAGLVVGTHAGKHTQLCLGWPVQSGDWAP